MSESEGANENSANLALKQDRATREVMRSGLSDRSRTLALGLLALVWAVFNAKPEDGVKFSGQTKHRLLAVGVGAAIVVGLDLLEYLVGYLATFPGSGASSQRAAAVGKFTTSRRVCFAVKIALIMATLVFLSATLLPTLHGESIADFTGLWCKQGDSAYLCLKIEMDDYHYAHVWISRSDQKKDIPCTSPTLRGGSRKCPEKLRDLKEVWLRRSSDFAVALQFCQYQI